MTKPLRVFLSDLSHINAVNRHNLYIPLNIGFIAAYLLKRFGAQVEVSLFKDPVKLLAAVRSSPPECLGLGAYYWKSALNDYVTRAVKLINPHTSIVVGGPCIDSAPDVQERYMLMHPNVDAIIPNEGEVAFGNWVEMLLGDGPNEWDVMGGVVSRTMDGSIVRGSFINLSTDLATIPSPYLSGVLDEWLDGTWQPMLQTSRLCPYTCAFCVSGKDRGKLRAFPLEQVKEEIDYVVRKFRGPKDAILYITDENFGILDRDVAIAEHLARHGHRHDYAQHERFPQRVFFYNDKRFTGTSRAVHERLGSISYHGVCLSLQSENPEALKAMHRRNLTDEQVADAIAWAKGLGFKTSTELIFGVPGERFETYCATVDKCARAGFDVVNSYNLITFDGVEMDRARYREQHEIKTAFRPIHGSASVIDGAVIVEREEVVVASKTFSLEDFLKIRRLNVMLKAVYALGVEPAFFRELVASGRSLSAFLLAFSDPALAFQPDVVGGDHAWFCARLQNDVVTANLFDDAAWRERDAMISASPEHLHAFSNAFLPPDAYGPWISEALRKTLSRMITEEPHANSASNRREVSEEILQPGPG